MKPRVRHKHKNDIFPVQRDAVVRHPLKGAFYIKTLLTHPGDARLEITRKVTSANFKKI